MEKQWKTLWMLAASYALTYMMISYPIIATTNNRLFWDYAISCMLDFTVIAVVTTTTRLTMRQSEMLRKEKELLSQKDLLTGLYNYEESHRRLEQLIQQDQHLIVILIDCTDLKSMNTTRGFQAGNFILKQMADLLQILFKEAFFISRYGGDEFAVVIPLYPNNQTTASYKQKLDSELPKLTGIQITYGIACYPFDGQTKDDLILLVEHNLFMKKRDSWLKREEHMHRSEKLRVVGELASGMAHEIRNPLTTVRGFLQISKENGYNIENWYSMIMDEIDRMSHLTGEFLQFSKPHSNHFAYILFMNAS
ncbi:GGDEF domain-containing protein [Paenibacillus sp. N3.4]|uniref:GGDEF domain-containing protein n=1 Tax=Paenibacillus sp. N3.4 TaxID=2603222 RepID=UPI001650BE7D|nr:GGDEF domain-containing protein [Paenibacillus sp. N3.4]